MFIRHSFGLTLDLASGSILKTRSANGRSGASNRRGSIADGREY